MYESQRKWRENNPEKQRAILKKYRESHREKVKLLNKEWKKRNPDKIKEHGKKYRFKKLQEKLNDPKYREEYEKRVIAKIANIDSRIVPTRLRFEILKRDNFTCQYCGATAPKVALHVDHIISYSRGGKTISENLKTACFECNIGKYNT